MPNVQMSMNPITGGATLTRGLPDAPNIDPNNLAKSPYSSALSNSISNLNSVNPNVTYQSQAYSGGQQYTPGEAYSSGPAYQDSSYQAKDYSNSHLPGYDALNARLASQYAQNRDQAQDTLNRQFASMGGGPSGALAKQTENLATGMAAKQSQDQQNISFQEEQQKQQLQQAENQKAFQSQEAQKGRGFAGYELGQQQQFAQHQTGEQERYGSFEQQQQQKYSDFQRQATEQFQNTQDNANRQLQQAGLQVDASSKLASLDQQWGQTQIDAQVQTYNGQLSAYQAAHSGGLLGGGGILGTGIGV